MPRRAARRRFLRGAALAGAGAAGACLAPASFLRAGAAPAVVRGDRPLIPYGVACGDVTADRAMLWSRSDRPARMMVEYAFNEGFEGALRVPGPAALQSGDFTARIDLDGLPPGRDVFYRVTFQHPDDPGAGGAPVSGRFRTAPPGRRDIRFLWSADTAGQGWGINEESGGMKIYDTMRRENPDFFVHCGDTIYADDPIEAERTLPDGTVWKNLTTEAKSKVAETLGEFRGNFVYNLMDANVRAFNSEVPVIAQWDDHETLNNWYPQKLLSNDERYATERAALLAARARRAFLDYTAVRLDPTDVERLYRVVHYGPALDVFVVDTRSYRGPNIQAKPESPGLDPMFLGSRQMRWLKQALRRSTATWKVIACSVPLGAIIHDDWRSKTGYEGAANADGLPMGRELEIAGLLAYINRHDVNNVVWLTGDVHYTAAHLYDPGNARFRDFRPFWEFVSGPLNAGTFGPVALDDTFGPRVVFQKTPPAGQANLSPSAGLQFYGEVSIDGGNDVMTVRLKDLTGAVLFARDLAPDGRAAAEPET